VFDKMAIYKLDFGPELASTSIYDVTEDNPIKLVEAKGKVARVRANRLGPHLNRDREAATAAVQRMRRIAERHHVFTEPAIRTRQPWSGSPFAATGVRSRATVG
jgi:hypothetical protein